MVKRGSKNYFKIGLVIVFFLILVLLLARTSAGDYLRTGFSLLQRPLYNAGISINETIDELDLSKQDLITQNNELNTRLTALALEQAELNSLRQENESLKILLGYIEKEQYEYVTTQAVSRINKLREDKIIIDKGSNEGITVGNPVIIEDGIIIGKISEVSLQFSTVSLLTDWGNQLASTIQNTDKTIGLIEGGAGGLLEMNYIPQDNEIHTNDIVITSGLEESIPRGLIVGLINDVVKDENQPFQQAVVEPLADLQHITIMTVITGKETL